jgi:hypothetical protein
LEAPVSNPGFTTALAETETAYIRRLFVLIFVLTLFVFMSSGCAWNNKPQDAVIGAGAVGAAGAVTASR